jgi:genetic interactor of prohibitins 3, mitochondrial
MRTALRHASKLLLQCEATTSHTSIPAFLCPALLLISQPVTGFPPENPPRLQKAFSTFGRKRTPDTAITTPSPPAGSTPPAPQPNKRALPICCPGCGAPTQILASSEAGYYSLSRGAIKSYLNYDDSQPKVTEDDIFTKAIKQVDNKVLEDLGLDRTVLCKCPFAAHLLHR